MKKLYWRPQKVSRIELSLIAIFAVSGLLAVEKFPVQKKQSFFALKIRAARLADRAFKAIKEEKIARHIPLSSDGDPLQTGLIGELISPIVSSSGHLPAKQTSVNPNFAAVMVHYLKRANVQEGDVVAVGCSGSFPAINVATLVALETLKVKPLVISSVAASQWGATAPEFTWLDMEKTLFDRRIINFRSVMVSRGGIEDRGWGIDKNGKQLLDQAIARSELPQLNPHDYADSVEKRMAIYNELAGDKPITAYINIGGGTASVGTRVGKMMFKPGLNRSTPHNPHEIDSVMQRFSQQGIAVVHMVKIIEQAQRYGLPEAPTSPPVVGQGRIFMTTEHNTWLAVAVLLIILTALVLFVRLHLGMRIFAWSKTPDKPSHPAQMV